MAAIAVRDGLGLDVISANPQATSGFGKYLSGNAATLLAAADVANHLRSPLHLADAGERGLGLSWSGAVPLGNGARLTIAAGAKATIDVYNQTGMLLVEDTFIGAALKVPAGRAFVAFAIQPSLDVGVRAAVGSLSFGFSAGSQIELRYFEPFALDDKTLTVAGACTRVLEHFVVPNTADDLRAMDDLAPGALACVTGHGQLQIAASMKVAAAFNPLASVDTLGALGTLTAAAGASASVGVKATLTGDFQIRAQKMDGAIVRLSYHKMAGRSLDVALGARAGAAITLGDKDLTTLLFSGPGGMPGAGRDELAAAGIAGRQLERVTAAMKSGVSRTLEVAVSAQFSKLRRDEAAFLYEIDLRKLDADGTEAVDAALAGDLTAINALEADAANHGITVLQSRTEVLRRQTVRWRINLVGLINVLSMSDLVRTGTIAHDEESGELVISDKVSADRLGGITTRKQIRRLLYESAMMSVTYKAAGLDVNTGLSAAQSFFVFDNDANRQRVSDFLDAVAAVGLIRAADAGPLLGAGHDFGKASLFLETTFDHAACVKLFDQNGTRRDRDFYEGIGRSAVLHLVKPEDPDAYRRIPMLDDRLWAAMKDAGQPRFPHILPPPITGGDGAQALRVAVVAADYSVIAWWAEAMAQAAERLADMTAFLNGRPAQTLDTDPAFRKRRGALEEAMVKAIRRNTAVFDDPWGLVALFMASNGTAAAAATLISPTLTLSLPD